MQDGVYWAGGPAVDVALAALDTFVPDAEFDSVIEFFNIVKMVGRSSDHATVSSVLAAAPIEHQRAVMAVFATLKASGLRI